MPPGLRDLLALQGGIPLSKPPVTTTGGLTLAQASGVWITGASAVASVPGLSTLQVAGVWITGASAVVVTFTHLSLRDIQYEALQQTGLRGDTRTMEHDYWLDLFGGRGTTADILYEGIILGLGFSDLKGYYDNITGVTWPDANGSEKAYWLKILTDNI